MIRLARLSDIPRLVEIENILFKHGKWGRSQFWRLIEHGKGKFWVINFISGGRISAYIYVSPHGRVLSIAALGKVGFGSILLRHAEKHIGNLHMEVCVSNHRAIRFYRKHGYVQYGVKKKYYENGEDALLFHKDLKHEPSNTV